MEQFEGRTAVITGAASGIGLALAERAAAEGMNLVLADVDLATLEKATAHLGGRVERVRCDVSDAQDVEALAAVAHERFGAVHLLCNNAGVGGGGMVAELNHKDWEWVLGVNLWGVIHGVSAFLPAMLEAGEPAHIVNTASMAGHFATAGMAPYAVSKFGVVALSESMRAELGAGPVKVSVLCPGWVSTNIYDSERSRPDDLKVDRPEVSNEQISMARQLIQAGLPPSEVAGRVFDAVAANRFWIFTHSEMVEGIQARTDEILGNSPARIDASSR